ATVANEAIPSTPTPLILPLPPSYDIPSTSQVQSLPPQQPQSSPQAPPQGAEFPTHLFQQVLDTCSALTCHVENLEHDKVAQNLEIIKLKAMVKRLERANKVKSSKLRRLKKVGTSQRIESSDDMEDVFNQGRMIDDLDKDERIDLVVDQVKDANTAETKGRHAVEQAKKQAEIYHLDLDHPSKVLSMQEDNSEVQEVVEVVTTAMLITEVVTAATSQVSAASVTIFAAKPSIPAAAPTIDKGKGILIENPKPMKKKDQIKLDVEYARKLHEEINKDHEDINMDIDWDAAIDHVKQKSKENHQYIKRYHVIKKRPQTESKSRKNMMVYLKNTAGYKLDFFKGMSYDEIHPIFQARFDANMRFLLKSREEMEEEDREKHLEVVNDEDDDVFTEATPLARKIRSGGFMRNSKREIFYIKTKQFSDEYLLTTLKTMFEKLDGQDVVWKSQRSVHGLALVKRWKLLTSCGVHIITLSTIQLILLVERRYPLSKFTLEQLVNVTRLQVEEESEMPLELLRFIRQQLQ
nr:hypothetical protein [Tanacetum cinerariifolium]